MASDLDASNDDDNDKKEEDEDMFYENESNEDLVKMRHQRELFLQKVFNNFALILFINYYICRRKPKRKIIY